MFAAIPLNHTLPELIELGLLRNKETEPLFKVGITSTFDLLAYHHEHKGFTSIEDLSQESQRDLTRLVMEFLRMKTGRFTAEQLFADRVNDTAPIFVPIEIDWSKVTGIKRDFLDHWITRRITNYHPEPLQRFFKDHLGEVTGAEDFNHKAILYPLRPNAASIREHKYAGYLTYVIKMFLRLYHGTRLLDEPMDLLKCWVWNEYGMAPDKEYIKRISELYKGNAFPFAMAVYKIELSSSYFNHLRGYQDINRMRYVSLFNNQPYSYGDLAYLFRMSEEQFNEARDEAESEAVNGCRAIIDGLKALGFKSDYRDRSDWREDRLSMTLVSQVNRRENLLLPAEYYAFLFNELYGTGFKRTTVFNEQGVKEIAYLNSETSR
ncbi:MAG: hypothetical protein IPM46_04090 [Flavobacteriales bacterium]|nr:hypothetical protein [Flavobacteriales bacterium]